MPFELTKEQNEAIHLSTEQNNNNIKIIAYAGAGKTSVLKLIAEKFQEQGKRCIYLAFNKAIVEEARSKMPRNTTVKTFNSLAFNGVKPEITRKMNQGLTLQQNNFFEYFRLAENLQFNIYVEYFDFTKSNKATITLDKKRIFQIVRKTLEIYLISDTDEIQDEHIELAIKKILKNVKNIKPESLNNFDETNQNSLLGLLRDLSNKLWADYYSPTGKFKISHDVYLKLYALSRPNIPYDVILFDESQDANNLMLSILKYQQNKKIIFVGDPYQQIYDWRGAVNAMEKFEGKETYLTQSFRFGNEIANVATVLLENLNAPKPLIGFDSIQSIVDSTEPLPEEINVVLSRTNDGLIWIALEYSLQYPDKKIYTELSVNTKIIGEWFKKLERFSYDATTGEDDEILSNFTSFSELEEYCETFPNDDDISPYVRLFKKCGGNIRQIIDLIENSHNYQNNHDVLFTTVHKSKGKEWDNVLLNDDFRDLKPITLETSELRLMYVAVTRAKKKIYIGRGKNGVSSVDDDDIPFE